MSDLKKITKIYLAKDVYISAELESCSDYMIIQVHFHNPYVDYNYQYRDGYDDIYVKSDFHPAIVGIVNEILHAAGFKHGVCSKEAPALD